MRQRLIHARDLVAHRRPVVTDRHLVQRLAGADPEERAAGEQPLQRHPRLRDQRRVVARARWRDAVPNGTRTVACPAAPSHGHVWPDSPGSHHGWR